MTEPRAEVEWFRQLFYENVAWVGRCLRYLGVSLADVEDVCQEVFLVAHRVRPGSANGLPGRAWLYTICLNAARNHRRSRARKVERAEMMQATSTAPLATDETPETDVEKRDRRRLALELLDALDDEKREVWVLHEIEELTMDEIAHAIEIPVQTGYSRLRAARERLAAGVVRLRARGSL